MTTNARQLLLISETIRLPHPGIATFTVQGLTISENATESDLLALGTRLLAVRSWTRWGLGSVFAAMLTKRPHPDASGHAGEFDTGWVSDFADAHRLDHKERRELIGVALFYGGASPTPHLSFEHHREAMWGAANLSTPAPTLAANAKNGAAPGAHLDGIKNERAGGGSGISEPPTNHAGGPSPLQRQGRDPAPPAALTAHAASGVSSPSDSGSPSGEQRPVPANTPRPIHASCAIFSTDGYRLKSSSPSARRGAPTTITTGANSNAQGDAFRSPSLSPTGAPHAHHAGASPLAGTPTQRTAALAYLRTADASGMTLTQLRAHIRASQRTEQPVQRELSLAAYSAVFDFHRFAARELSTIAYLQPERARMILADLGQESLDFLAALQRVAANTHAR